MWSGGVPPDADGLRGFARQVELRHGPVAVRAAIESMTGARFVHDTLERCGWQVEVADAQKVKGLGPLACKTDKIDAWVLAELSRRDLVPAIWLPSFEVRQERERARWRLYLVRKRSSLKHRIHAQLLAFGHSCPVSDLFGTRGRELLGRLDLPEPWRSGVLAAAAMIDDLDQQTAAIERELRQLGADHHYVPILMTAPGVAWVLGYTIAAEIGDITRFASPKKLCGYTGLCPKVYIRTSWSSRESSCGIGSEAARRPIPRTGRRGLQAFAGGARGTDQPPGDPPHPDQAAGGGASQGAVGRLVDAAIVKVAEDNQTDGYRMVAALVARKLGRRVNRKRVLRVMRERRLIQRRRRLDRRRRPGFFQATRPDELWQLDMTSVWVAEHGWCYLMAAIDCCTREIVGWHLELRCRAKESIRLVEQAAAERAIRPGMLTLGTDNGSAFTASAFKLVLTGLGIAHRRGGYRDPESQAFIESWFSKLKERCVWLHEFETLDQAREVTAAYIDSYHHRPHSGLNYRTPAELAQTWDWDDALGDLQTHAA